MLLLALDQGTTSSRAILFEASTGAAVQRAVSQLELPQIYPPQAKGSWVEHDPMEIWRTQLAAAREVMAQANVQSGDIAAVGITNQRETTVLWDRATGVPLHNAIVWQDRRTAGRCAALKADARTRELIQSKTGLIPDAYFSASKLEWLLDNVAGARERAMRGELAFGTVDSWLLYHLTGGPRGPGGGVHATDVSNASRTMLLNVHNGLWDIELFDLFRIPYDIAPLVKASSGLFGETHPEIFGRSIPITGIAGDQQAALFGQGCITPGLAKNTYGTGCFTLMNTGNVPAVSKHQLLTTIAWQIEGGDSDRDEHLNYALEGSVFIGGAVVQWLRDGLGIIQSASEIEALAASVPDSAGVYLVPAFAGLGAPHWDQYARGSISGITRATNKAHLARAAVEAIAFQVADLLDVMHKDAGGPMPELRVDGGASRNNLLLQFQADLLRIPVMRPRITETTALGAALLAALGAGLVKSPSELAHLNPAETSFLPKMTADEAAHRRSRWNAALRRSLDWEEKV